MFTMKLEEDMRYDHVDEDVFDTDDEAETGDGDADDNNDSESDADSSPPDHIDSNVSSWPQSYRQSIDILLSCTPPSINRLRHTLSGLSRNSSQISEIDSSLSKSLIPTDLEKEESGLRIPAKSCISSCSKPSFNELPLLQSGCSYSQAQFNAINLLCGIGIMTVPYAISQGGWLSLSALFIFGALFCYTGVLLKRCLDSSPEINSYPDIGQAAFGRAGRIAIAIALYSELYTACVEYLIMVSDNLSYLFPTASISVAGMHLNSINLFAPVATLILLPTVWLRNLSVLSYLSLAGVLSSFMLVISLFWVEVEGNIGFHPAGTAFELANLPFVLGIYGFCFAGHSVFPNIYTSMKKPSQFPSVLVVSFIVCGILYSGVGICGFLMFGNSIKSQFTLNMPQQFVASKVALWTGVVNPVAKYSLTLTPVALGLEELLSSSKHRSNSASVLIRTSLTVSTLVVVLTIPFFAAVMSLCGSLLAMLVAVIFPCACYLRICRHKLNGLQVAQCYFTISIGVLVAISGTYSAIYKMFQEDL